MEFFKILEIDPTNDKEAIRQAYRKLLPKFHPEDDPEGFQRLRNAFEEAMKFGEKGEEIDISETDIWIRKVEAIYRDFGKRLDTSCWEELLDDEVSFSLDTTEEASLKLLNFLIANFYIPHEVWAILERHFSWEEKRNELYDQFPVDFIDYIIANANYEDSIRYYLFKIEPDKDYDRFIEKYFYITRNMYNDEAEEMEQHLEEAISMGIEHPDLTILRIRYEIMNSNLEWASSLCAELLEEYQDIPSWYIASRLELTLNNTEKAREYADKILAESPEHVGALIIVADSFCKEQRYEEALDNYQKASKIIPYDNYVNSSISDTYSALVNKYKGTVYNSPNTDEKMKYLLYSVRSSNYEEALKIAQSIDVTKADLFDYYYFIAQTHVGLGNFEKAIDYFEEALKHDTNATKENLYADYGLTYMNMNKHEEALNKYEEGLALYKESTILTYRKAAVKIKFEKYEEAVKLCDEILSKKAIPNAYHFKAEALYFLGEYEAALKNCDLAIQLEKYYLTYVLKMNIYYIARLYEPILELANYLQSVELETDEVVLIKTKALYELERYAEARSSIEALLEKEPDNHDAQYQLAKILYGEKKYEEALHYLQKAEEAIPDKKSCAYFYGNIYINLDRNDEAEEIYLNLLEEENSDYSSYRLGYIYERTKRYSKAIEYYEKTLEINPEHYYANGDLADIYQMLNKTDKALSHNKKQLQLNPADYFYVQRGNLYGKKKNLDKQLENFHKALELNPSNSYAYNNAGTVYIELVKYETAVEYFAKSIKYGHPHSDPYLNIGLCLLKLKRFDEAVTYLKDGAKIFNDDSSFYTRIGELYYFLQDYEKAINFYEKSLDITEEPDSYIKIGKCYKMLKNSEKALEYYSIASNMDKKNSKPIESIADLYYYDNNFDRALYYYKKAFKLNGNSGRIPLYIGKIHMKLKDETKAINYFKKALSNYIGSCEINNIRACDYKNIADTLFELRDYESALECYNKALEKGSYYKPCSTIECYWAYFGLGETYEKIGDYKNSLLNFKKAAALRKKDIYIEAVERVQRKLKN